MPCSNVISIKKYQTWDNNNIAYLGLSFLLKQLERTKYLWIIFMCATLVN